MLFSTRGCGHLAHSSPSIRRKEEKYGQFLLLSSLLSLCSPPPHRSLLIARVPPAAAAASCNQIVCEPARPLPQPPPFKQPSYTHCDAIFCRTGLPRASPVDPPEPAQAATDGTTIRVYLTSHFWAKLPKYRIRQHN